MTTDYHTALKQAQFTYRHRENLSRQELLDAAVALGEWGCFSIRHVVEFTGLPYQTVFALWQKTDRTGGKFTAAAIEPTLRLIELEHRGERDIFTIRQAVDAGASFTMVNRFTGIALTNLKRWYAQAGVAA